MRRLLASLAVLMMGLAFTPNPGWAQDAENVRLVGRWPYGPAFAVTVQGNYTFLGSGGGIWVLDVSDPSSPEKVGELATPGIVKGLFISGDYLYVADEEAGLRVIDVSHPSNPQEVGACDTPGQAEGVYVSGSLAYVADWGVRACNPGVLGSHGCAGSVRASAPDHFLTFAEPS